jgi:hypothetical protein
VAVIKSAYEILYIKKHFIKQVSQNGSVGGWILESSPIPITKKPDLNDPVLRPKVMSFLQKRKRNKIPPIKRQ